jgi:hypothetical protein
MMAGLVYPAETNPLTKLESKKSHRLDGKPSGNPAAGDESDCSAFEIEDDSWVSIVCAPEGRRSATGLGHRCGLIGLPGGVGRLWRLFELLQYRNRCRTRRIRVHRGRVLRPHFAVVSLRRRDCGRVEPKEIGRDQCRQLSAVGRDRSRGHRRGIRALECGRRRRCLSGGLFSLGPGTAHPRHVRGHRDRH